MKEKEPINKKLFRRKFIIPAVFAIIFFCIVSFYILLTQEPKPDPKSEAIIRKAAALQLQKEPNDLTDEDFTQIKSFLICDKELSDIRLLEKFTNLESLKLNCIKFPEGKIPEWIKILGKLGILNPSERIFVDLKPIGKLNKLQTLHLNNISLYSSYSIRSTGIKIPFKDISPLSSLINLTDLNLSGTYVSNIEPLKNLKNLKTLDIGETKVSNLEPLKDLISLELLHIFNTGVSDIKPLKGLQNLQKLFMSGTKVSDIKPLKELENLEYLDLTNCPNITDEQVEDLQRTLPNLEIHR